MWQEASQAIRSYRRMPLLAAAAITMLALGVGLNTAVFTFLNAAMLRPFPFPDPERLAAVFEVKIPRTSSLGWPLTAANLSDLRAEAQSVERISASTAFSVELAGDEPVRLAADRVLTDYFQTLGVPVLIGRVFQPEDYDPSRVDLVYRFRGPPDGRFASGLADRVILSYELWQRQFGSDPDVVGRDVTLDGGNVTVVGVMPRGFQPISLQSRVDVWLPEVLNADGWTNRTNHRLTTVARLREGVSPRQASAEIAAVFERLERQYPFSNDGWSAHAVPLGESTLGESGRALALLLAGAGLVLLIACANVASLLLARASRRRREIVTRIALGASLPRLLRQLLVESGLLGLASGVGSLAVAYAAVHVFSDVRLAMELPFAFEPRFDRNVWAFVLGVSLATSVVFGLAPSAHVVRFGRSGSASWQDRASSAFAERGGRWLVASQIAVTVVLLGMGGFLWRSLSNLSQVALGFEPERIVSAAMNLPPARYEGGPAIRSFIDTLLDDVRSLPGVEAAAVASQVPFGGSRPNFPFSIEGREGARDRFNAMGVVASDAFFRLMRVPLVRGRVFDRGDGYEQPWVVVINQTMAETYWPGADPIGERIRFAGAPKASTIIGIVGNVEYDDVQAGPERQLYVPHRQLSQPDWFVVVRSAPGVSPLETARAVGERVRRLDPRLPLTDVRMATALAHDSLELPRFQACLLGLYAGAAFAIAMGGLFALLSLSVARRTSEIGVRMALGADSGDVSRLVMGEGMKLAAMGAVVGLVVTMGVARYVSSFLFGVSPNDPATLATIAALVLGAASVASYLPARRATRTDPTVALRHE